MGVSSTANRILYVGNAVTENFSFPYYFWAQTDLDVYVYDTVAGGTVLQTLNNQYSIVGTPNLQGLYLNGAEVEFVTAPPATAIIVIVRNPPEQNNYALGQNGAISSASIVQQFDYLTLLIQRLEDQLSLCPMLSDGMGESFLNTLPSNAALVPGTAIMVNATGNGWVLGGGPFVWQNVVFSYTQFTAAALTQALTAFVMPPGYLLKGVCIKHQTAFAGTAISDVQIGVGTAGDATKFIDGFDVYANVSDSDFDYNETNFISSWVNPLTVQVLATAVGGNLSALTAGQFTVWYLLQNLSF